MPAATPLQNGLSSTARLRKAAKRYGLAVLILALSTLIAIAISSTPQSQTAAASPHARIPEPLPPLTQTSPSSLEPTPSPSAKTEPAASTYKTASPPEQLSQTSPASSSDPELAEETAAPASTNDEDQQIDQSEADAQTQAAPTDPPASAEPRHDPTLISATHNKELPSHPDAKSPPSVQDTPQPDEAAIAASEDSESETSKRNVRKTLVIAPKLPSIRPQLPSIHPKLPGLPTIVKTTINNEHTQSEGRVETDETAQSETPPQPVPLPVPVPLPLPGPGPHPDQPPPIGQTPPDQTGTFYPAVVAPTKSIIVKPATPLPRAEVTGDYVVQILATPHEDSICAIWDALRAELPDMFEYANRSIIRVETGDNQVLFRLRVGAFNSREEAAAFCAELQSKGHSCFVPKTKDL